MISKWYFEQLGVGGYGMRRRLKWSVRQRDLVGYVKQIQATNTLQIK